MQQPAQQRLCIVLAEAQGVAFACVVSAACVLHGSQTVFFQSQEPCWCAGSGAVLPPPGTSPHVLANAIKAFLITMPEPLLTFR